MTKWLVLFIVFLGGVKVSAQCDSLALERLSTTLNYLDYLPSLNYIKLTFEKAGEDSLAYYYVFHSRSTWSNQKAI